ncbi:MAG: ankyrin repeat domain-containing protein [Bacteroidota bacterium]
MNTKNIPCKIGFVALMMVLAVAASCHVHTPDEAQYQAQVAERDILDPLLSDHDHLEEHHGQCLVKVMQPQEDTQVDLDLDTLEATDPLILAAKCPFTSSGYSYFTPLMYAIRLQAMPAVKSMLAAYDTLGKDHKLDKIKFSIPSDIQNTRPPNAGYTALLMALIFQNVDAVQLLVANGAPVNMHFEQAVGELGGSTPIHVGVATQNALVVEAMLVRALQSVDLEVQDSKNGSTPLDLSLSRNYMNVAKCLLEYGADPNRVDHTLGWRPLSRAILKKDPAMVELLLSYGANPYLTDASVSTPLHMAILAPSPPIVKLLVRYGVDINTLLCSAITERQDLALVEAILSYPEVNVNHPMYDTGCTALHLAVIQGFDLLEHEKAYNNLLSILRCLLSCPRTNVNAQKKDGNTALHFTIMLDRPAMTEAMLEYHPDRLVELNVNIRNNQGEAPLHRALRQAIECHDKVSNDKALRCLSLLLEQPRIDVNLKNRNGYTPLHLAFAAHRRDLVQLLSAHPTADFNAEDSQGNTLLHRAVEMCSLSLVQQLLRSNKTNVNAQNKLGNTPLHLIALSNMSSITRALMERYDIRPNIQNREGAAPIHSVVYCNALNVLPILLSDERVDLDIRDLEGYTPLHLAILYGRQKREAAEMLLRTPRLDLSISDENGDTALDLAKEYGSEESVISMFLERMSMS